MRKNKTVTSLSTPDDYEILTNFLLKNNRLYRIRKNGEELYLNSEGQWADRKQAKKFKTSEEADNFANSFGIFDHGLFY